MLDRVEKAADPRLRFRRAAERQRDAVFGDEFRNDIVEKPILDRPGGRRCGRDAGQAVDDRGRPRRRFLGPPALDRGLAFAVTVGMATVLTVAMPVGMAIAVPGWVSVAVAAAIDRCSAMAVAVAGPVGCGSDGPTSGRGVGRGRGAVSLPPPGRGVEGHHPARRTGGRPSGRNRDGGRPQAAGGRKLLPQSREMLGWRAAPLVELEESRVGPAGENPAGQPREHARGPDLDEGPHARVIQIVHHLNPADRLGHLPHQAFEHGSGRVEEAEGRAADGLGAGRGDRQAAERLGQLVGRGLQQRRVERTGHGQPLCLHAAALEQHLDRIDHAGGAADDVLLRRICRADPGPTGEGLDRGVHRRGIGDHRQHRPVAGPQLLDRHGPGLRRPDPVGHAPGTAGGKRGKLAEAVAGDEVGREAG